MSMTSDACVQIPTYFLGMRLASTPLYVSDTAPAMCMYQQNRTSSTPLLGGLNDQYVQSACTSAWDKGSIQKVFAITIAYYYLLSIITVLLFLGEVF